MLKLFIDFETYYDDEYSLKNMTTAEYIHDQRFLSRGAAVACDDEPAMWLEDSALRKFLATIDWDNTVVIAHNTLFDGYILVHHYGCKPKMWCDTASLVNYMFDWDSASLKNSAKRLGLQDKGDALEDTKGVVELSAEQQQALDDYAIGDVEICRGIYNQLVEYMPPIELDIIDMTIDMMVYPRWEVNADSLIEYADRLAVEREARVAENIATIEETMFGQEGVITVDTFASSVQFERLLQALDVEVPTKLKKATAAKVQSMYNAIVKAKATRSKVFAMARKTIAALRKHRARGDERLVASALKRLRDQRARTHILFTTMTAPPLKVGQLISIPALAKTDEGLIALLDHENPAVAAAVATRLDVKSTINETRARTLAAVAKATGGTIPTPLRYCGAHTNRHSGREYNLQNLPSRGDTTIRAALTAPKGFKLVVADLSQIEPRTLAVLADCQGYKEAFKPDGSSLIYETAAAKMYHVPIDDVTKAQRQMGKVSILGQGYGMGWKKFISFAKMAAKVELTDDESKASVKAYRSSFPEIPEFWALCDEMLPNMSRYKGFSYNHNGILFRYQAVVLPSGRFLRYDNLDLVSVTELDEAGNVVERRNQWVYGSDSKHGIYGGQAVENLTQALARDVVLDMACAIRDTILEKRLGELIVNLVHDEVVCVVREDRAEDVATRIKTVMSTTPHYMGGMPLSCTVEVVDNYAEAK